MTDGAGPIHGPSWLASTAIAELGAAIDLLELADQHVDVAEIATDADAEELRSVHRHALTDSGARALLSIAASLAILCKAHEIEDPGIPARMWADGYRTGRADEAGDLPIDPRALYRS
jgi:hypothetical protein